MNTSALSRHALAPPAAAARYTLEVPQGARRALARAWLWLGLLSLIGSGLFSVLVVLSRTPGLNQWLPVADFFRVALVAHVDLSVLVWFSAIAGMLWSLNSPPRALAAGWAALGLAGSGTALMSLAPFVGDGAAVMANYIPVLDGPLFLGALALFGAGASLLALRGMCLAPKLGLPLNGASVLRFGLNASVVSAAVAMLAFCWSLAVVPAALTGKAYYEIVFWGGGHALQFTWTLLMLVAWLWLADAGNAPTRLPPRVALLLFALALAGVFATPYAYLAHGIASVEHRKILTMAMRVGGGLAILPVGLAAALALASAPPPSAQQRSLRAALAASVLLFAAGGVAGVFINGENVRVPAHYHGCIVGVTLALMGLVYHLLPQFGYSAPNPRWAALQPWLYGAGQLLHIAGLLWSGGYGVQRKVAGAEQTLRSGAEVAGMGLMGLGGLIAIAGGLLFVVLVAQALRQRSPRAPT